MTNSLEKSIFVTGGTGLLGSYLLRKLVQNGYSNIRALKRKKSPMALVASIKDQIKWVEGDIRDVILMEDMMEEVEQVYHCAGLVSYDPRKFAEMKSVNVEGTANIVNVALHAGVKKLVHVSSIAAIGRHKELKSINEKTAWQRSNWNSQYAISKYQAEMEVWRGIAEGLNAAIVNPSVILGSGLWTDGGGQLFKKVWDGLKLFPKGGTGFVDVRDVAIFMIQLMESELSERRFILNGANLSFQSFFEKVARNLNKKAPSILASPFMAQLAWRLEWLRIKLFNTSPLITKETALQSSKIFIYENESSLSVFDDFKYRPIEQTIEETGEQFMEAAKEKMKSKILSFKTKS